MFVLIQNADDILTLTPEQAQAIAGKLNAKVISYGHKLPANLLNGLVSLYDGDPAELGAVCYALGYSVRAIFDNGPKYNKATYPYPDSIAETLAACGVDPNAIHEIAEIMDGTPDYLERDTLTRIAFIGAAILESLRRQGG